MEVHDDMYLYVTPEHFYIEPNTKSELLVIDRLSSISKVQYSQFNNQNPTRRICGVLGTIHLIGGDYLIIATHRLFVGLLNGMTIWRLAGYDILPYIPTNTHLTLKQREQNEIYLRMMRKTLDTNYFYFSYAYDLSHTLQRLYDMPPDSLQNGVLERADQRFIWNAYLLKNFNCSEMRKFQLPLLLGFVSINQVQVNGQTFHWSIVSRRSTHRAGTRFFCRGINDLGQVANFVETEQIIEFSGQRISFVQTRGSMPFFWRQLPNLRYKPRPELIPGKDHLLAFSKHFDEQIMLYGRQVLINLVDQKGHEGALENAYRNFTQQLDNSNIRYEAFDFHAECKKMRWDRLNILIDRVAHEQEEFAVFHLRDDGGLISAQEGVFRTNCIDCLDRTNVVQSMLAKRSLNHVLQKLGILSIGQKVENASPQFEALFKAVWADNADLISLQYSGTGALKTDFTRTGKRTKAGLLQDGSNSLTRYYYNNFSDGFRQDSIDLFLGNYSVNDSEGNLIPSPLVVKKGWRYNTFPSVFVFAVAMFFISAVFPAEFDTESLLFILFWGAMIGVSTSGILHYGIEFVDWPRLFPPIKIEA
ncbi:phosphatidylinositol-3-phosphatase SAC1-like [Teleopsis dalmanni]|uniref:phosphatidylinositol-3-phosphatase SAC1-like n=1 Tax=Teleopsis dalmanni TaxID=139649 RepID=UPI0018CCC37D|nr:phosphatidylinositol-3-phosphatase SAC1-like [Teleopsis dalmanni]XP_037935176.1 phosphatidylinositol-3-phosphatase SAC1-like [Teleopsis dalmanni]